VCTRGLWLARMMPGCSRPSIRSGEILSVILFFSMGASAQGDARSLVVKMVNNELAGQKHVRYWMFLDHTEKPHKTEVSKVIQTPECWFTWPLSINEHPPTAEQKKHASEQVDKLVNEADARKKNRDQIDADEKKSNELLQLLPDAFLFTRDGRVGNSIRLKFRPNPKYKAPSSEARVFHAMEGFLFIHSRQMRLARLEGRLVSDVDFGLGILGKLRKGGSFEVVQSQVAPKDWEMSLLDVHISGRALFFHTIGEQQHEVRSGFKPVPPDLSLQSAASMLKQDSIQPSFHQ
jgi:hypothetical protein